MANTVFPPRAVRKSASVVSGRYLVTVGDLVPSRLLWIIRIAVRILMLRRNQITQGKRGGGRTDADASKVHLALDGMAGCVTPDPRLGTCGRLFAAASGSDDVAAYLQ